MLSSVAAKAKDSRLLTSPAAFTPPHSLRHQQALTDHLKFVVVPGVLAGGGIPGSGFGFGLGRCFGVGGASGNGSGPGCSRPGSCGL